MKGDGFRFSRLPDKKEMHDLASSAVSALHDQEYNVEVIELVNRVFSLPSERLFHTRTVNGQILIAYKYKPMIELLLFHIIYAARYKKREEISWAMSMAGF